LIIGNSKSNHSDAQVTFNIDYSYILLGSLTYTIESKPRADASRAVESRIGLKGGFGLTPGKLLTLK